MTPRRDELPALKIVPLADFLNGVDDAPPPLIGARGHTLQAVGGLVMFAGPAGSGKTTLMADGIAHVGSATPWLGFEVPRPVRVLLIENEGTRQQFQEKLQDKQRTWTGRSWADNVMVLQEPWAMFSFADTDHRTQLHEACVANAIDLVVADPLESLGVVGAGTPEETRQFIDWLKELGLHQPERPLAFWLLHHYSKRNSRDAIQQLSGSWGNHPDAVLGIETRGQATEITWAKARNFTPPANRKTSFPWDVATRGFEEPTSRSSAGSNTRIAACAAAIVAVVTERPGLSKNAIKSSIDGYGSTILEAAFAYCNQNGLLPEPTTTPGDRGAKRYHPHSSTSPRENSGQVGTGHLTAASGATSPDPSPPPHKGGDGRTGGVSAPDQPSPGEDA